MPPETATARGAMEQATQQARRASEVIGRLRRVVERPDTQAGLQPVVLQETVRNALYLLEPEGRLYLAGEHLSYLTGWQEGGITVGDPCEARAYHGFNGIEREVITRIAAWIAP